MTTVKAEEGPAVKFLQSVVVVDDMAELGPPRTQPPQDFGDRTTLVASRDEPQVGLVVPNPAEQDGHDLNAKLLIDGFASRGVVCAVLRPDAQEEIATTVVAAVKRADIVILDWILHKDQGEKALDIISKIVEDDAHKSRLRLILVYSGAPNLAEITEKIRRLLELEPHVAESSESFTIVKGPIRISIFAKPDTGTPYKERITAIENLPDVAITEFAQATLGLLPGFAVSALAALRADAHRLLSSFHAELDPAYLGHRILLPNPVDAEDHLVTLFSSEVRAILDDHAVGREAGIETIKSWLTGAQERGVTFKNALANNSHSDGDDARARVLKMLQDGIGETASSIKNNWGWSKATQAFLPDGAASDQLDKRFATFLHLKTTYPTRPPKLTLGTVVLQLGDVQKFWLCMQPKCDSTRLPGITSFPFLPLSMAEDHTRDFQLVVPFEDTWLCLVIASRIREVSMFQFEPDAAAGGVVKSVIRGSEFEFSSADGRWFRWLAELKDEHAQRAADEFAATIGRVGLDESEWVRRSGTKTF